MIVAIRLDHRVRRLYYEAMSNRVRIVDENDGTVDETSTVEEFFASNEETLSIGDIEAIRAGKSIQIGGGAAPRVTVRIVDADSRTEIAHAIAKVLRKHGTDRVMAAIDDAIIACADMGSAEEFRSSARLFRTAATMVRRAEAINGEIQLADGAGRIAKTTNGSK